MVINKGDELIFGESKQLLVVVEDYKIPNKMELSILYAEKILLDEN